MTNSDPSPLHPSSFDVPGQGLETNGGWRGKAWVARGPHTMQLLTGAE